MTIYTDPGILRTIIFNLLSNCAEYTPVDGLISIKANNDSTHQLLIISNTVDNMKNEMVPHLLKDSGVLMTPDLTALILA